jgi:hypothetical protein
LRKQAFIHRTTNHLFDEGKKDVAGKSHDSCAQTEVDRESRGGSGGTDNRSFRSHLTDAGAGAERIV